MALNISLACKREPKAIKINIYIQKPEAQTAKSNPDENEIEKFVADIGKTLSCAEYNFDYVTHYLLHHKKEISLPTLPKWIKFAIEML